jgi:hypothetical protein
VRLAHDAEYREAVDVGVHVELGERADALLVEVSLVGERCERYGVDAVQGHKSQYNDARIVVLPILPIPSSSQLYLCAYASPRGSLRRAPVDRPETTPHELEKLCNLGDALCRLGLYAVLIMQLGAEALLAPQIGGRR